MRHISPLTTVCKPRDREQEDLRFGQDSRRNANSAVSSTPQQFLIFGLAGHTCALRSRDISSIQLMAELSRPPVAFSAFAGFLNLSGENLPVLHLAKLLGLHDEAPTLYTPVVVLGNRSERIGLIVQNVQRLIEVAEYLITSLPGEKFADTALTVDGKVIAILVPGRLLLEQEQRCLSELQKDHQRRLADLQETA